MYYILSILLGLVPEVLYFTLYLIYIKNLKEKKVKLFLLIGIAYFICILIQQWQTLYYVLLIGLIYIILKFLYKEKTQITDIFVISILCLWLTILSFISLLFLNKDYSNFYLLYIPQRILIFLPLIFKNKFNKVYIKYYKLWNRNDAEKRPIKSITLRNISLISLNMFIFILNISLINMINTIK